MIDPSDLEIEAMKRCLKALGEVAGEIGYDKPVSAYSKEEALMLIDAVVTQFTESMVNLQESPTHPYLRRTRKQVAS